MKWFKRKSKIVHHDLRWLGWAPIQKYYYKPVYCHNCGKRFIMDVFGGWSIEHQFRELGEYDSLTVEDIEKALEEKRKIPVKDWIQLGFNDVCTPIKGDEQE